MNRSSLVCPDGWTDDDIFWLNQEPNCSMNIAVNVAINMVNIALSVTALANFLYIHHQKKQVPRNEVGNKNLDRIRKQRCTTATVMSLISSVIYCAIRCAPGMYGTMYIHASMMSTAMLYGIVAFTTREIYVESLTVMLSSFGFINPHAGKKAALAALVVYLTWSSCWLLYMSGAKSPMDRRIGYNAGYFFCYCCTMIWTIEMCYVMTKIINSILNFCRNTETTKNANQANMKSLAARLSKVRTIIGIVFAGPASIFVLLLALNPSEYWLHTFQSFFLLPGVFASRKFLLRPQSAKRIAAATRDFYKSVASVFAVSIVHPDNGENHVNDTPNSE